MSNLSNSNNSEGDGLLGCFSLPVMATVGLVSLLMLFWSIPALIIAGIFKLFGVADDIGEKIGGEGYVSGRDKASEIFTRLLRWAFIASIVVSIVFGLSSLSNRNSNCDVGRGGVICY